MRQSLEIRLHGRGGQGGVTCAKILATVYAGLGKSVQTFGDYAGERSGAPVRAYTRVADRPITDRNKVYRPDHLVVLDPTLLGAEVLLGLVPGGTLLINTSEQADALDARFAFDRYRLATVDATAIARRHGIGSRSLVIVNTTIAGAFARAHDIPFEVLERSYRALGFQSNLDAAREAFEAVEVRPARTPEEAFAEPAPVPATANVENALPDVEPIDHHVSSPPTSTTTGSWSTQQPRYVENLAPCNAWCPAGNDVVGFIQAAARDGERAAAAILGRSTPLAAVCGRVCPAPCMAGCNRSEYDGAVNIRGLERRIADCAPVAPRAPAAPAAPAGPSFHIAILGSGPAGLAAAYTLALSGHRATLFEGERELGGVLRTGIPDYRLPRGVLDREIGDVLALGVEARCGTFLTGDDLRRLSEDHDALILATGLQKLRALPVEGQELAGIEQGIRFLHRVNLGDGSGNGAGPVRLRGHVVVLGGGNTAIDCARSAVRSGAEQVTVAYRRTQKEMPAIREEIDEAAHEGVELLYQKQPVRFAGDDCRVDSIELAEVVMGEPDETGRRRPCVTDETAWVPCDHVLLALGQSADLALLPDGWELRDGRGFDGDRPLYVFAAGDLGTGDGTVTHAIGSGRRAAGLALQALGVDIEVFERPDRRRAVPVTDIRVDHFARSEPAREAQEPPASRRRHFFEVSRGLEDALEAHRCFSCGHCTDCDTCLVYCPEGIIQRTADGYEIDYTYCKGCGICVTECPRSALEMNPR